MADQPNFTGFILNMLSGIGQGVEGSTRAAQDAAKEAKAAKEAAQRQQKGGNSGSRSGIGGVIDGLIPETRNAKSITAVLSQGIFGKAGLPPSVPDSSLPSASPQSPGLQTWDSLIAGVNDEPLGFADESKPTQPAKPSVGRRLGKRVRGGWQAWKQQRAESKWQRENGPLPMDDEGAEQWRQNEDDKKLPFLSRTGRQAGRWAGRSVAKLGSSLVNRGTAMGGKLGGVISEVGSFMGGRAVAGAATSAMSGAGTVAGGAAMGGMAAAAASVVGLGAAAIVATKGILNLSASQVEAAGKLSRWSGSLARMEAEKLRQDVKLDIKQAKLTSGMSSELGHQWMAAREGTSQMGAAATNLLTSALTGATFVITKLLWPVERIAGLINKFFPPDKNDFHPFMRQWNNMKNPAARNMVGPPMNWGDKIDGAGFGSRENADVHRKSLRKRYEDEKAARRKDAEAKRRNKPAPSIKGLPKIGPILVDPINKGKGRPKNEAPAHWCKPMDIGIGD